MNMQIFDRDTIAAISTAVVNSGISIIRISGDDAFSIADKIFRGKTKVKDMKSHTVAYGKIVSAEEEVIDEVLLIKMDGPKTYTREDTVEINCHGGVVVTNKVFHETVKAGARVAEPGGVYQKSFFERTYRFIASGGGYGFDFRPDGCGKKNCHKPHRRKTVSCGERS
jgi:tRNA modification GTPase